MKSLRITVSGRVQGVCFRMCAQEEAERLGVRGFVRNEPDGRVCIEAEGDDAGVEALLRWCHRGPPHAVVRGVAVEAIPPRNAPGFTVSY